MEINKLYEGDCLEVMKQIPDKSIDLVLTDPPYGIGINKTGAVGGVNSATKNAKLSQFKPTNWDDKIPEKEYFDEIIRISKNQIIWGGNYFIQHLFNSSCWIVWDKNNEGTPFADCELAWTSFDTAVRKFKFTWNGMIQEDMKNKEVRHHPTQKPVELMKFCLDRYSKPGDTILDCFAGSGTTGIACMQTGRNYILIEKDPDYCKIIEKRLRNTTPPLFVI